MKINSPKFILPFVLVSAILVQLMISFGQWLDLKESLVILASSAITATGWYFSSYLNHRSFERSEFIKNKDKLTSLVDTFFDELNELMAKKETDLEEIEAFVANKTAELSLKASQLERVFNSNVRFLSDNKITELQNKPIDIFTKPYRIQKVVQKELQASVLEEIDCLYENWLKSL